MQQIGSRGHAAAIAIDPARGQLVPRRGGSRVLAPLNRKWIVHRQLIVRGLIALAVAALIAGTFQARGGIMVAAEGLSKIMQGEFAAAGLGIDEIGITGQVWTREEDVVAALELTEKTSIIGFDVAGARARLLALPAIDAASIRKVYPNSLVVTLVEKEPIARWRVDGVTAVVDTAGNKMGVAANADEALPLIIGEGAGDDAPIILRALQRYPDISVGLIALSRLADRRWDMIYKSGLRVQLPETGVAQALSLLQTYQVEHQILDRDVTSIDMRVNGILAVRPTFREDDS